MCDGLICGTKVPIDVFFCFDVLKRPTEAMSWVNINKSIGSFAFPPRINHEVRLAGCLVENIRIRSSEVQVQQSPVRASIACSLRFRFRFYPLFFSFGCPKHTTHGEKNAIIVNSRICFQQAIYALSLIDIPFLWHEAGIRQLAGRLEARISALNILVRNFK